MQDLVELEGLVGRLVQVQIHAQAQLLGIPEFDLYLLIQLRVVESCLFSTRRPGE